MEESVINEVENSSFPMLRKIKWRNNELEFNSVSSLVSSLDLISRHNYLERSQDGSDVSIQRHLLSDSPERFRELDKSDVKLLWEVCQIPDFRKISNQDHAELIMKIFDFIRAKGFIPSDWLELEIDRLDKVEGDIDILSKRLSFIRTWSFVSNISKWLSDSEYFVGITRNIEDKLSDALHIKLTQRFVDLRRSVLINKSMKESFDYKDFELREADRLYIKGHLFGQMDGFVFNLSGGETVEEKKKLMQLVRPFLHQHLSTLVKSFYEAHESDIILDNNGYINWRGSKVGMLEKGQKILVPKVILIKPGELEKSDLEKIQRKLDIFIEKKIKTLLPNLLNLANEPVFFGAAAGLVHIFINNLGVVMKSEVMEQFKSIDHENRSKLRNSGIRFGYKTIYDPMLLKPEASKLRVSLFNIFYASTKIKVFHAPPGLVTVDYDKHISKKQYLVAGFFVAGSRAIRVDMLERLYFLIKECTKGEWTVVQPSMLSITGLGLENFAELLKNLRFELKHEKVVQRDETITFEKDGYYYKVLFKKELRNKKVKIQT